MKHLLPCFFLSLLAGPFATSTHAQINPTGEKIGSTRKDSIPEGIMPLDTPVPMTYVLLGDPDEFLSFTDTFVWEDNKHFPLTGYQAHLGNYGSAARSLAPDISTPIGFSPGWFQYDPYYIQEEDFRYYSQDVPVAKIKYSQGGQEDTYLTLDFGRSFARGLSLSVAYDRINQVGEFNHQRQKNTGFSIGVWHNAPNGKYDAFYNYLNNAAVTQENGGIKSPELIGADNTPDIVVPIYLALNPAYFNQSPPSNPNTAITTHKQRTFMTKQIIHLLPDSSRVGMDVWLKGSFSARLFKYVDEDTEYALDYYHPIYLTDDRGIRQYTYIRENEWSFGIALPWKAAHSTLDASLRYRGIDLEQEPIRRKINELYFDVSGVFQWVDPLMLKGDLSLGLGQAQGVFSFSASADLNIGLLGYLTGDWSLISRKPYMIESALYVSQEPIYMTDFSNPLLSEIGVEWDWVKQDFQAGIKWLVYDNYIYFDSIAFPQQIEESFSLRRFHLSKGFDFRKFGLRGGVFWQPDPRPELAVPELWYSASAYGRIHIFDKKVELMPGLDIIYNGDFTGITYFPVNGSYHLTNGPSIPDAFRIDAALGLQINFIKAFVRLEDLVGLFKDRVLYQADYYPHFRGYFRIGVEAGFFN